jgi:hypothetical protein
MNTSIKDCLFQILLKSIRGEGWRSIFIFHDRFPKRPITTFNYELLTIAVFRKAGQERCQRPNSQSEASGGFAWQSADSPTLRWRTCPFALPCKINMEENNVVLEIFA